MICFVHLVTGVELYQPRRIDTADCASANHASPGQVLSDVGHAADVVASGIKSVRVDVESMADCIHENEVALPRIGLGPLMEPAILHQAALKRHLPVW